MCSGEETIPLTPLGQVGGLEGNRGYRMRTRRPPAPPMLRIEGLGLSGWVWGPLELRIACPVSMGLASCL